VLIIELVIIMLSSTMLSSTMLLVELVIMFIFIQLIMLPVTLPGLAPLLSQVLVGRMLWWLGRLGRWWQLLWRWRLQWKGLVVTTNHGTIKKFNII
jgi:hypothetical protein